MLTLSSRPRLRDGAHWRREISGVHREQFLRWGCCLRRTREDRDLDQNNPIFQAVIVPFAVAFLVIGPSRLVGWRTGSEVLAGLGVAAGLLTAFVQLRGIPPLPPNSAPEKLFYLIMLAGLIGVALDLLGHPPRIGRLAFVLFPAICLTWFNLRPLLAHPDVGLLIKLALMWAGAAIVLWLVWVANARGGALAGAILILATAVGAAGVAALAPFIGVTLLCASVAAVAGAFGTLGLWRKAPSRRPYDDRRNVTARRGRLPGGQRPASRPFH